MTDKKLPFNKAQMEKIIEKFPTPFHIYDEKDIRHRARALRQAFSWNEGYKEYYAVKACPNPIIMSILRDEGCGMDCSSYAELMLCEAIGVVGDGIMFSSNDTPAKDFEYARRLNATINLDDITHIEFLKEHGGIPETISCRFNPGGEFRIGTAIMGNPADAKYGFTREQLTEGFKQLKALGVKHFGLHSFLSSCNTDNMYYPTLAKLLFTVAKELHEEVGVEIAFINLSGGIGIPYRPEETATDIAFVGEKKEEREAGYTNALVTYQTQIALSGLTADEVKNVVIAYEPVWAIGTGLTATDEQANETIGVIREAVRAAYGDAADDVRIQYGGSMNPKNCKGLMAQPEIDGGLIGGASLKAEDFSKVVRFDA